MLYCPGHAADLVCLYQPAARVLIGNDQNNALNGQGDDDFLYGRGGNDTLVASGGADNLYGGDGADVHDGFGSNAAARYDDANYGDLVISLLDPATNTGAAAGGRLTGLTAPCPSAPSKFLPPVLITFLHLIEYS